MTAQGPLARVERIKDEDGREFRVLWVDGKNTDDMQPEEAAEIINAAISRAVEEERRACLELVRAAWEANPNARRYVVMPVIEANFKIRALASRVEKGEEKI